MSGFDLTDGQRRFFEDFGFLVLRGRLVEEVSWISEAFDEVFAAHPERRSIIPFADSHEKLATLVDHPSTVAIADALVGEGWSYVGSDGNIYGGETPWHRDGTWQHLRLIKIAMYLEPLTADTGALRVVPGSNHTRAALDGVWLGRPDVAGYGIEQRDMPGYAIECEPGDVAVFSHTTLHASFGGGDRRRMFTLNAASRATTPEEIDDLRAYIALHVNFGVDRVHGRYVRDDAPAGRRARIEQVVANEGHLAALAREKAAQPAVTGMV